MRLVKTSLGPSPLDRDYVRLAATIAVESRARVLDYWFDFPAALEHDIAFSGNAAAILMLPLACFFDEPLHLDRSVDRKLFDNLKGIQQVWNSWFPEFHHVDVIATSVSGDHSCHYRDSAAERTISCFSGGIDSLFTFLRHKDGPGGDGSARVDDLLCIGGFNTSLNDVAGLCAHLNGFAQRFGRTLVPVVTNVRYGEHTLQTPYSISHWMDYLAHGALLATVVHLLGNRYRELLIPASNPYAYMIPLGTHPLVDPLFSSSRLSVVHDGASFMRIERTALVAQFQEALNILHVCWQDHSLGNCSHCEKCLRTMAALDLLGAKERARTFDWTLYSMDRLSRVWLAWPYFFGEIAEAAEKLGRDDIAAAARASLNYSKRKRALLRLMNSNPFSRGAWQQLRALGSGIKGSHLGHRLLGTQRHSLAR